MSKFEVIEEGEKGNGRSPLLIFAGFTLLGIALALLIFGSNLFDGGQETAVLPQIPSTSGVASLPSSSGILHIGDTAPDFKLQDLAGNTVALSDFRGQPVLVNFWATWCAPCRIEMPELQAAYETYRDEDLVILALNQDEAPEAVRSFFYDQFGLTFTPLLDIDQEIAGEYGVFNYPSTFFINGEGVVTAVHRGPVLQSQIDDYLADTIQ
jgi:peroxiredoxin